MMQSSLFAIKSFAVQSDPCAGLHVAIIMDGNGRWATQRGLPRIAGHRAGGAAARRVVEHALEMGIRCLTLYAFSSDNWRRPVLEVHRIFWLLRAFLRLERERLRKRGVRLQAIGRRDRLPKVLLSEIHEAEEATAGGRCLNVRVALDYSSRDAITRAAMRASSKVCDSSELSAEMLGQMLAEELKAGNGDVDLLIRTGGEKRLSDFLLWESAYAELLFTDRMWPDFDAADLEAALEEFRHRERRFGGIPEASAQFAEQLAGGAE
ncbi:di-trans,poly-cis-decaprenylcistransferase [Granulicella mallensis]|uniref:Isoprenyl transferase n=1 Tax=Granulicella mallensis TaxID=940614 RepID=A0A7W7ZR19_9BACT|nr:di-trans,poly-cis-decaprenylcistransferase [Granulicella mallensis]MBB5064524.1 undecaprenyl diphosphate synthase [Granulicella mallensis]